MIDVGWIDDSSSKTTNAALLAPIRKGVSLPIRCVDGRLGRDQIIAEPTSLSRFQFTSQPAA